MSLKMLIRWQSWKQAKALLWIPSQVGSEKGVSKQGPNFICQSYTGFQRERGKHQPSQPGHGFERVVKKTWVLTAPRTQALCSGRCTDCALPGSPRCSWMYPRPSLQTSVDLLDVGPKWPTSCHSLSMELGPGALRTWLIFADQRSMCQRRGHVAWAVRDPPITESSSPFSRWGNGGPGRGSKSPTW